MHPAIKTVALALVTLFFASCASEPCVTPLLADSSCPAGTTLYPGPSCGPSSADGGPSCGTALAGNRCHRLCTTNLDCCGEASHCLEVAVFSGGDYISCTDVTKRLCISDPSRECKR